MRHRAYITRTDRTRVLLGAGRASAQLAAGAICKRDTRSAELIVANYVIRTPRPRHERYGINDRAARRIMTLHI